jgi:hypothetical protein
MFTWYWLADLCAQHDLTFVLGHALYMKAIHGGKAKNDKIDAHKIAALLRGGLIPMAYAYPAEMRATRDLLRRRCHLMQKRAELLTHIQNTASQYNLPTFGKKIAHKVNRTRVAEHFPDPAVRKSIEMDLALIDRYEEILTEVELVIVRTAKVHDPSAFYRLRPSPASARSSHSPSSMRCTTFQPTPSLHSPRLTCDGSHSAPADGRRSSLDYRRPDKC